MRSARLLVRVALLFAVTLPVWLVLMAGLPLARALGRAGAWRGRWFQGWSRAVGWIIGMRVAVDGATPTGAFLLVSNHLSYVDIILLASRLPCVFVSKAEVADWPVLGWLARSAGTIFVDRGRGRDLVRVSEEIGATLQAGQGVVLFPEGTSTQGAEVTAFRSSLLAPAAELGLPVRYASIRYTTPPGEAPAHQAVSWWGGMTLGPHILELLRLSGFEAHIVFGEELIRDPDRKALAQRLQRAVASCFVPMFSEGEACLSKGTSSASC